MPQGKVEYVKLPSPPEKAGAVTLRVEGVGKKEEPAESAGARAEAKRSRRAALLKLMLLATGSVVLVIIALAMLLL